MRALIGARVAGAEMATRGGPAWVACSGDHGRSGAGEDDGVWRLRGMNGGASEWKMPASNSSNLVALSKFYLDAWTMHPVAATAASSCVACCSAVRSSFPKNKDIDSIQP